MANGDDIFQFGKQDIKAPYTADRAILKWDNKEINAAINVQISYQQQINRRRVIGNKWSVRWGTQPQGQLTCQRILVEGDADIYKGDIWNQCKVSEQMLEVTLNNCEKQQGPTFKCSGPIVTQLQVTVEAESLTCLDNVVIEFMQLFVEKAG